MKTNVTIKTYDKVSNAKILEKTYKFKTKRNAEEFKNIYIKISNYDKINKGKICTIIHKGTTETTITIQKNKI